MTEDDRGWNSRKEEQYEQYESYENNEHYEQYGHYENYEPYEHCLMQVEIDFQSVIFPVRAFFIVTSEIYLLSVLESLILFYSYFRWWNFGQKCFFWECGLVNGK